MYGNQHLFQALVSVLQVNTNYNTEAMRVDLPLQMLSLWHDYGHLDSARMILRLILSLQKRKYIQYPAPVTKGVILFFNK